DRQVAPLQSDQGPYQTRWLLIDEHTGTHMDAPAHFIPEPGTGLPHAAEIGARTTEQIPLDQTQGPAAVIDVPEDLPGSGPGRSPFIQPDLLEEWEEENGRIAAGEVVLFHTGWDRHFVAGEEG